MSEINRRHFDARLLKSQSKSWLIGAPAIVAVLFLGYLMMRPDVAAGHFGRAQSLQAAGQLDRALRLYTIIVETSPQSAYAPLALQQEGEILTALARQSGDAHLFHQAIETYARLANEYSSHSAAGEALLSAGSLALGDLNDPKTAENFYKILLERYASNADYASEATLRLGRIALDEGDSTRAQQLLNRVLQNWSRFPDRCAEAQYHLGVTGETLLKNPAVARAAYEATIKKYPRSVWAGDAKERLGMMSYNPNARPSRRVLLEISPLPKTLGSARETSLRLILAARGLEISDALWRGWSLSPFRAGFAPRDPGRVLAADGDWETVAANAGLVYSRLQARDANAALNSLRDELDSGHAVVLDAGGWGLIVGYDSLRDEIFERSEGGREETFKSHDFAAKWRASGEYSMLAFRAPGERLKAQTEKPDSASDVPSLVAPNYLYKLPPLSLDNANRRAARRAAALMRRAREGEVLLNLEALRALKTELEKLSAAPPASPVPSPETEAEKPRAEEAAPDASSTPAPQVTPTETPAPRAATPAHFNASARWKNLRKWFGAPMQNWIEARRDAAAFCDAAGKQTSANGFRASISALENAASTLPDENAFDADAEAARAAMKILVTQIETALREETRAANAMS